MTIPEIRAALLAIANSLAIKGHCDDEARGIRKLVEELWRRPAVRQSRAKADPSTRKLRAQIRAYAAEHPDMLNREIGRVFNVDSGRVSEALAGFRR